MTVTLGGITLSDHLVLSGIETAPGVVVNSRRLLGGALNIQTASVSGGRALTLSGENHFTLAQVSAIKVLEAQGQSVELIHPRGTFNVLIIGTPVEPEEQLADQPDDAWYSGDINLLEV